MYSVGALFPSLILLLQGLSGAIILLLLGMLFYFGFGMSPINHQTVPDRGNLIQPTPDAPIAPRPPEAGLV